MSPSVVLLLHLFRVDVLKSVFSRATRKIDLENGGEKSTEKKYNDLNHVCFDIDYFSLSILSGFPLINSLLFLPVLVAFAKGACVFFMQITRLHFFLLIIKLHLNKLLQF